MKLNVDEAIFFDDNKVGVRAILKHHKGEIVLATSIAKRSVQDSEDIKLIAIIFRTAQGWVLADS